MRIGILRIGQVDPYAVERVRETLNTAFAETECTIIAETLPIPEEAYNSQREQHRSDIILRKVRTYAERNQDFDRVLGIVDTDLYVQELSFVFGEAECPGKAALISLWRLKQEFYGKPSNTELFWARSEKEAVHELGHTLGLRHCTNPFCAMYFSNSIFDTDRKQSLFCNKCQTKAEAAIDKLGDELEPQV